MSDPPDQYGGGVAFLGSRDSPGPMDDDMALDFATSRQHGEQELITIAASTGTISPASTPTVLQTVDIKFNVAPDRSQLGTYSRK